MRFTALLILPATLLCVAACHKESVAPPAVVTPPAGPLTTAERQTVGSANDFAYRLFGAVRQATPDDNLFLSPLSVSAALAMAWNGADGSTKTAMQQTLGFAPLTDQQINQSYQSLLARLGTLDPKVTFTAANSIWHGQQYQLAAPFVQANQTYFGATVQSVNFAAPAAKDAINGWVAAKTSGKITTILDHTSADDVLYLLNALYFKGSWTYRFDAQQTRPGPFRLASGSTRTVDFMNLPAGTARYRRYLDNDQEVIDLPYGNRQFSMTFVMPSGTSTLASVAARLTAPQLNNWLGAADSCRLALYLPKFRLEYEKSLSQTLTDLGMGVAFGGQANFERMLAGNSSGLQISEVKHKAVLEVNEEGSEAAAVTSVGVINTSVPPSVYLNRPFLFLIREQSTGAVLFMGQLTQP